MSPGARLASSFATVRYGADALPAALSLPDVEAKRSQEDDGGGGGQAAVLADTVAEVERPPAVSNARTANAVCVPHVRPETVCAAASGPVVATTVLPASSS